MGDRIVKDLLHSIKLTIDEEPKLYMKIFWFYRALVTLILFVPILYILGFIFGILFIANPHVVGKHFSSIIN